MSHLTDETLIDRAFGGDAEPDCDACAARAREWDDVRDSLREALHTPARRRASWFHALPLMAAAAVLATIVSLVVRLPREEPRVHVRSAAPPPVVQDEPVGAVPGAIVWLVRHQRPDGSWGPIPGECECFGKPPARKLPARDADVEKQAKPLIEDLRSDDPEVRDRATDKLIELRRAVEPFLEDAASDRDAEVRARVVTILRRLREGDARGDTELTALSVLAMMGAGYSHLSKEAFGSIPMGQVVKGALKWLMDNQNPEGRIGATAREAAIAALALSEAYGLTASNLFKDAAQAAVDWVASQQRKSGAWGDGADDTQTTYWALLAIKSAELSPLKFDRAVPTAALEWLKRRADKSTLDRATLVLASKFNGGPDVSEHVEKLAELKAAELDPLVREAVTHAVFVADGPSGASWKKYNVKLKDALLPTQGGNGCGAAGWGDGAARGRTTALNALTLEIYYRYANVLGWHK